MSQIPARAIGTRPGFAATTRGLAEATADRLVAIDEAVFQRWIPGKDLRAAFVYPLALELGMTVLPGLEASTEQGDEERPPAEGLLHPVELSAALRWLGHEGDAPALGEGTDESGEVELERLEAELGRRAKRPEQRLRDLPSASAIIVCGTKPEAERLGELARLLRRRGGSVVLGKSATPECVAAIEEVRLGGAKAVVEAGTFAGLDLPDTQADVIRAALAHLRELAGRLEPGERGFLIGHAATMLRRSRLAIRWSRLADSVAPRIVAGTLDRSSWAPITALARDTHGYKLVEVQHGVNLDYGVADLMPFDLVLAFNQPSKQRLLHAGFPAGERIAVVGDPRWDGLRTAAPRAWAPPGLADWKGTSALVCVLPQPRKGPLTSSKAVAALYGWVARLAEADPNLKVLVKTRHGYPPDPEASVLGRLTDAGRARIVGGDELGLEEALACSDLAVSMFSSALLEARAAGVRCVATDPDGVITVLGLDRLVRPAGDYAAFEQAARGALRSPSDDDPDPDHFPELPGSYRDRVRAALKGVSALPGPRLRLR